MSCKTYKPHCERVKDTNRPYGKIVITVHLRYHILILLYLHQHDFSALLFGRGLYYITLHVIYKSFINCRVHYLMNFSCVIYLLSRWLTIWSVFNGLPFRRWNLGSQAWSWWPWRTLSCWSLRSWTLTCRITCGISIKKILFCWIDQLDWIFAGNGIGELD